MSQLLFDDDLANQLETLYRGRRQPPDPRPGQAPHPGQDNVTLHLADATALPVASALAELHRALRPGGRLVVWDVDCRSG
jgi:hypothetical protein